MKALAALYLLLLSGCLAGGLGGSSPNRNELTREEISRTSYTNAFDMVNAERPLWLRIRGRTSLTSEPTIGVFVDGQLVGGPDFLGQLMPHEIEVIRYYDARQAQFRFGPGYPHGALNVILRTR